MDISTFLGQRLVLTNYFVDIPIEDLGLGLNLWVNTKCVIHGFAYGPFFLPFVLVLLHLSKYTSKALSDSRPI
ncbi:hypothetical protein BDN70DRAFT_887593 [Pholiota conissans]|uniref:Uncharacterized protein n=1 Tax=Pholiota conissans TaxID=109636 RepID=A0A9P5YQ36_9AGAR|nr:hypothetical protein BDN70DRAFT_887593 [Pholiota conissans]